MRIVYGINPVLEALNSHPEAFKDILILPGRHRGIERIRELALQKGIKPRIVEKETLERLARTHHHQGVIGILAEFKYADIKDILDRWRFSGERALILVLDCIQDPQNLGSLVRSAHAAGAHGIIIPKDRAAEVTPTVVKASAGAAEYMLIARVTNIARALEEVKGEGIWIVGVEADAKENLYKADMGRDLAVVIGSEGEGIRRLVKERCDMLVSIPMKGKVPSLNAAVAGAVTLFELVRRRIA